MSGQVLKISQGWSLHSRNLCGQPVPVFENPLGRKCVLVFKWSFLYFSLCPLLLVLLLGHRWGQSGSVFFTSLSEVFVHIDKIHLSLLFSRWTIPVLSNSFHVRATPIPFIIFVHLAGLVYPCLCCTGEPRTGPNTLSLLQHGVPPMEDSILCTSSSESFPQATVHQLFQYGFFSWGAVLQE